MSSLRILSLSLTVIALLSTASVSAEELDWQACLQEAAKNHPDLIAAQESVVQENSAKTITASSGLPQITADAGGTFTNSNFNGGNSFSYGVSGSQLIFDGFKTANNIHAASENIKAAQQNFQFTSATVRFRLRESFVNLLKAQESLNLTQEIYKIRKDNVDLITLRYQSGTEHKGALLTAQANLSEAEFEINQAQRNMEVAQRNLIKELGRREFLPIVVKGVFTVSDAVLQKPDFDRIAKDNPSLQRIIAQRNAAAFGIKSSEGDFWPELSVIGDVGKSDSSWPPSNQSSAGGFRVSLPIFEGGARVAQVAQSKSIYRQLQQQERSTNDNVVVTLEESWSDLQDSVESVKVQQNFLTAVEERSKIAEQQYSVGLISFDNWTIIEDDLVRNKKTFLDAQANALLAEASWIQAKGETLEYEK